MPHKVKNSIFQRGGFGRGVKDVEGGISRTFSGKGRPWVSGVGRPVASEIEMVMEATMCLKHMHMVTCAHYAISVGELRLVIVDERSKVGYVWEEAGRNVVVSALVDDTAV